MSPKVKNSLILLPVVAGVAYAGYLLFMATQGGQTSGQNTERREPLGRILSTQSEVKRQFGDDVVWNDVQKDVPVYDKDSLRTGHDSQAVVQLNDGTVLEMGADSLIVLDKDANNLDINFKAGDMFAKGSGKNLKIDVKDSKIDANGADLKIKTGVGSPTRVQVAKGKASITDKSKKLTELNEDEAADLDQGEIRNVTKVAVVLNSPDDMTVLKSNAPAVAQPFSWKTLDPRLKIEQLQISGDAHFPAGRTTVLSAHQAVTAKLDHGGHFWRVAWTLDGKTHFTDPRQLTVGADDRLELIYPEDKTDFDLQPGEDQVEIRWNSRIQPKLYVAELATSRDFKSLALTHSIKDTKDVIKDLPPQTYYWRVRAFGEKNEELALSPVRSFSIEVKLPELPELIGPDDEAVWDGSDKVPFAWVRMDKAAEYRVIVSKDEDQKLVVKTKSVPGTNYAWAFPRRGTYFWSVRALNAAGSLIGASEIRQIEVKTAKLGPAFELDSPKDKAEVTRDLGAKAPDPVDLQWKVLRKLPGPVTIFISRDPDFKDAVHQENLTKTELPVRLHTAGNYYWKLTSASPDGHSVESSSIGTFTLKSTVSLISPEVIAPNDKDQIETEHASVVNFSWKPVTNASQYHIVVQRTDPLTNQPVTVLDRILKETAVDSTPLPQGRYSWTLTSLDAGGQEGLTGTPYQFTLVAPQLIDAPTLNAPVIK